MRKMSSESKRGRKRIFEYVIFFKNRGVSSSGTAAQPLATAPECFNSPEKMNHAAAFREKREDPV